MKTIESYLPVFTGFYNTLFEPDEDRSIEDGKTWDDYEWDYKDHNKRMSVACCGEIENELKDFGITVEFENVVSPKFYNFTNDSINVKYELKDGSFKLVLEYLLKNMEEFKEYTKERYTSRSGFMSYYSNDAEVWMTEYLANEEDFSHVFGAVLEFILHNEGYDQDSLYNATSSEAYVSGTLK